ncbi:MAG: zinc ABC transporter substrate-binding protein [Bacilli bacterium]|nr:zinc ABC transporter substrate-binding protein [Bacilli bacterium]
MKIVRRIIIIAMLFFSIVSLAGCNKNNENNKLTIISTSFPGYDLARAIIKNNSNIEVNMLLKPGAELHDFEPTPQDIKNIKNSDIFIYVGGDSDAWIEDILDDIDTDKTKIIKLMDLVDTVEEEHVEGMEENHDEDEEEEVEYDEHVWTSPINAITITDKLKEKIIKIDTANKDLYEKNASNYINELNIIDKKIRDLVDNSKKKEIIFGDRFPLRYFVMEYNLNYYAAFPGCSEATEASAKTVSFLVNKVKQDKIPVVFKIELSSGKIAETIAKETGAKVLEYNTAHNITQQDFDKGVTIVDIMNNNIKVLKEALVS